MLKLVDWLINHQLLVCHALCSLLCEHATVAYFVYMLCFSAHRVEDEKTLLTESGGKLRRVFSLWEAESASILASLTMNVMQWTDVAIVHQWAMFVLCIPCLQFNVECYSRE